MKKTIEQKRLDFLNETVSYYSEDISRRSISNSFSCEYLTDDGKMCAIGRHIPKNKYNKSIENLTVNSDEVFSLLPKRIKNLGQFFLCHIQTLHDSDECWDENGITETGYEKINNIKLEFCTEGTGE